MCQHNIQNRGLIIPSKVGAAADDDDAWLHIPYDANI